MASPIGLEEELPELMPEEKLQLFRANMRECFLRTLMSFVGKKATFHMHGNTTVTGIFRAADALIQNMFVTNLRTPLGTQPTAVLRTSDMISITFHNESKEDEKSDF